MPQVKKLYEVFKSRAERRTETWKQKMTTFNQDMEVLFEIATSDENKRTKREQETGVKMGPDEWLFLENMRGARNMYCEDFVDRVWQKQMDDKALKEQRQLNLLNAKRAAEERMQSVSWDKVRLEGDRENNREVEDYDQDMDYEDDNEDDTVEERNKNKKKKVSVTNSPQQC